MTTIPQTGFPILDRLLAALEGLGEPAEMVDIALVHDLYEATPDTTPCPDCEWTDAQDLCELEAHWVLAHPCPKHTHTEEDQ